MKKNLLTIAVQAAIIAGVPGLQVNAQAQTDTAAEELDEILVTGSRLRRDSFNTVTPLVTMDAEEIQDSGLGSLAEILVDQLPAIAEVSSNTNTQSSVQNTGLSTINLRNLGTDRTLTLIDGRRVVSNSYSGNYVSLSTIPSGMVAQVEVISGGASAIYGSDAIAGVVNIITEQDKEGFEFEMRGGTTDEGAGDEFTLDLSFGSQFHDGRGYAFFSTTWDRQFGIERTDRKRAQLEANYEYDTDLMCNAMQTENGDVCMRDISPADWRDRSDGTAGGVFLEDGSNSGFYFNEDGLQSDWMEERDGLHSDIFDRLKIPNDRFASAFKVNYDITDSLRANFQIQYSLNESINVKSPEDEAENSGALVLDPETGEPDEVEPGEISPDNPFVPAEIAAAADGDGINWDRRFFEVGNVTTDNERETIRTWAGLQGELFDGTWDWDLSIGYGKFQQTQLRLNELNTIRVAQALDAEFADDGVTIQCADPAARAEGCVPLNIFGIGSITPEMADWIRANPTITTNIEQVNVLGYMAGDLFELPTGPVAAVVGFEYRRDTQKLRTNREQRFGGVTFNVVPSFDGEMEVWEVFGEAAVPLLTNAEYLGDITAETSLRLAEYNIRNIDLMASYRLGLTWEPSPGYIIRANYARAQRAPNITELLSPPRGDFDSFDDICDDTTANSDDPGHANCRLEPAIAAVIADGGTFEDENNRYSPNTGNPELEEETADTYTVGFVLAPDFLQGFKLAIDYYDITIDDAIEQISNEDIINQCYNSSITLGDPNPFCDDITRDSDGNIVEILQRVFNIGKLESRGYDVALQYQYDFDNYGSLTLKTDYNHVIEHTETFEGNDGEETNDLNGLLGEGTFEDKASASLTWRYDDWRVRWRAKYLGPVVDSRGNRVDDLEEAFAENQELIDSGDPNAVLNPERPKFLNYGSHVTHNLSVSKTLEVGDTNIRLYGGVNNVFDEQGPFVPNDGDIDVDGTGNFHSRYGGGVGRFMYMGARFRY
ncbi:TonB-dependent receptor [Exilibacterium tricleocarpae]|uniref:TonB-dependent receptor n=1 Tax=Exilibacterium tricleocarpae TaxID=2591008 RepID=A0A545SL89_9GAMM|nr:TonB-dependent receptor [Exilibacterium tricleocarpae]TQV65745.1 TonB-dependent receptor [Exilibacterium tricleocarpae]